MKRGQRSIPRRVLPRAGCRPAPRARAYAQISDLRSEARATLQRSLSRVGCRPAPYRAYIPVRLLRCHMSDLTCSRCLVGRSPTPVGGADQANDISKCCSSIYSPFHLVKIKIKTKGGRAIEAYESAGQPGAVNAGDREVYAGQPPGAGAGFWASDAT